MALENNTVLITGGSSGIGLELAKRLVDKKNKVIICGRSGEKLKKAQQLIPEVEIFQCDVSCINNCKRLAEWTASNHPDCNILINNAAIVHRTGFYKDEDMINKADLEIRTNLVAPVVLSKLFIPVIEKNNKPQIINVTTGLVYAPKTAYPIYNATKAGLHSFTQVLRSQLKDTGIAVTEVLFPAVDTPWHNGNPPSFAITTEDAVKEMMDKLGRNSENGKRQTEIMIGKVKLLYWLARIAPAIAMKKIKG